MVEVEQLAAVTGHIRSAPELLIRLQDQIGSIFASPSYQTWLNGGLAERQPYEIPADLETPAVEFAGLSSQRILRVKINVIGSRVFVTDGVWVRQDARVFPFSDESRALLRYVERRDLSRWADLVVDLAAGCGHNAFGFDGSPDRVALDVSPRAIAFLAFNRALNGLPASRSLIALNDIRDGMPDGLAGTSARQILFLANMPFGPAPARGILPPTSDGGASGADLSVATMDAIAAFAERNAGARSIRACLLALTVGDAAADRWEVVERAQARFGPKSVRWELLRDEKIFRISGMREQENPSPLIDCLPRIADCRLYVRPEESDALRAAYRDLARNLEHAGWSDMAYGVVDITVGRDAA
jgi:hypothetical protein